jgi:uncharacterized protein (DUF488 family)
VRGAIGVSCAESKFADRHHTRAVRFTIPGPPRDLWTIGHSTLTSEEFIARLVQARIETLVDVRRHAGSRRHPQFNPPALAAALSKPKIRYVAMPDLGGRRKPRPDSKNTTWRNESFRGYADYMETPEFASALARLAADALGSRCAIMCAESLWWRCHRSLIADAFKACGTAVWNIGTAGETTEHPFTSAAHVVSGELSYGGHDLFS